ncbi:NUDIX hydrolase [Halalkalibacterium halodurans]|uniref:NUDIX hydrolase n=1 Tax=Halalkalibacterium halodurans TaxID=86665 RepID=UPI002E1CEB28|nr:NUDIX hydrolase [Halalkalibacterium halodurans]
MHELRFKEEEFSLHRDEYGRHFIHVYDYESVVILAQNGEHFVLIKQFRPALGREIIQLSGGGVKTGESLEEAVRREMLEETGYECGEVQYLGGCFLAPWLTNEITHVFYTNQVRCVRDPSLESHEKIELVQLSVDDCLQKLKDGTLQDGELAFAVCQAMIRGLLPQRMVK